VRIKTRTHTVKTQRSDRLNLDNDEKFTVTKFRAPYFASFSKSDSGHTGRRRQSDRHDDQNRRLLHLHCASLIIRLGYFVLYTLFPQRWKRFERMNVRSRNNYAIKCI